MILVIDSGYGGLSFIKSFAEHNLQYEIIYFGDNARAPYGILSKELLLENAIEIIDFVCSSHDIELIVLACGTLSATVLENLKVRYDIPIVDAITPIFHSDFQFSNKIGVIATQATVESGVYQNLFKQIDLEAIVVPTQNFVQFVEGSELFTRKDLENNLKTVQNLDQLILGCTHFPFLTSEIQGVLTNTMLIDPAEFCVDFIKREFVQTNTLAITYYTSGDIEAFNSFITKNNLPKGEILWKRF